MYVCMYVYVCMCMCACLCVGMSYNSYRNDPLAILACSVIHLCFPRTIRTISAARFLSACFTFSARILARLRQRRYSFLAAMEPPGMSIISPCQSWSKVLLVLWCAVTVGSQGAGQYTVPRDRRLASSSPFPDRRSHHIRPKQNLRLYNFKHKMCDSRKAHGCVPT